MNQKEYPLPTLLFKLSLLLVLVFALSACVADTTPRILGVDETASEETAAEDGTGAVTPENISVEELEVEEGAVTESDLQAVDEAEVAIGTDDDTAAEVVDLSTVLVQATFLIDREVEDAEGQDIGVVEDFLVDAETGRILYVIIGYGGIASVGDVNLFVPLSALTWNPELEFALPIDASILEAFPTIDDDWPLTAGDSTWNDEIAAYWSDAGLDVPDETDATPIYLRSLFNLQVGQPGAIIGPVDDMLLDVGAGEVRYLAVFVGTAFHANDEIAFVPFSQLEVEVLDTELVPTVVIERESLFDALFVDRSLFMSVDFLDEEFSRRLDETWGE